MPRLVRLYTASVATGVVLAMLFTGLLVWLDVAGLRRLVLGSTSGWLGAGLLVFFNAIVFGGVQFAIAVMRLADAPPPRGGQRRPTRAAAYPPRVIPATVAAPARRR
ncbi:hypothetical protein [Paracoccus spongiarum]|uniref:Uncharacterized protein n=1 Tax=Paracoccus spongiarum TaxID=3064387 RepID=A0ABT9JE26_9RHOB|nr:hypothetical protein [Paracoccus sp. 2205BS29-5]MDP5308073.1 hypothetical protein [Paracoccus sp. 2205BS29-5]